jgi:hypothetical protein
MSKVAIALVLSTQHAVFSSVVAIEHVVPNGLRDVEGNVLSDYPFGVALRPATQRYQQVYDASEFEAWGVPLSITEIAFRPDRTSGPFSFTITNIQINLSTTLSGPDALSVYFADNTGSDETTVFSGSLSLSSLATGPADGPKDFDLRITLEHPFLYDPSRGNLLLDVLQLTPLGLTSWYFDAHRDTNDSISQASSYFRPPSSIADRMLSDGLVTLFTFSPIPEPSNLVLLGLGSIALVTWRSRGRATQSS